MDKEKFIVLKPLEDSKYENIDLDHLVMYAIGELEKLGAELSFENAVVVTFKLFPKKFALLGFPEYPDAKRIHDCLFRCTFKTKQWLGGKTRQGFIITDRSRIYIKEAEDLLGGLSPKKTKALSQTRRKEFILSDIISSATYLKYKEGKAEHISEAELCYLLQGTLDSARETLRENLNSLKKFAEELQRKDVLEFLLWLEEHFKIFLGYIQN